MRIISGKYGGRILLPPKNFRARPTTDLAKEGLFNILQNRIELAGIRALDLFAGTGNVGIEFISRGAAEVVFIEKNYVHFNFIRQAIKDLNISNAQVIRADFFRIINKMDLYFDLVFADPPYNLTNFDEIPGKIINADILNKDGSIILEHSEKYSFQHIPGFQEQRKYGSVIFSFISPGKD